MPRLSLYIDTTANRLVAGPLNPYTIDPRSLPFWFGDTLSLSVQLLNTEGTGLLSANPFVIIPTAGLQLFAYIDDGLVGGTIYTQQISWNSSPDFSYFFSTLSLNTAALQTLLGANQTATAYLKIGYVQNGLPCTVYSSKITIGVGLPQTNLDVPANLTALSVEVAKAMFVQVNGNPDNPGQGFILISAAGKQCMVYLKDNADGTAELDTLPLN